MKVVIKGTRLGLLTSFVCKVRLRDEVTVVTSFKEVSGKLSSASIKLDLPQVDLVNFRVEFVFRVEFFRLRSG